MPINIEIGDVQTMIIARTSYQKVPSGRDMLIGQPFLDNYSEGYRIMLQEFTPKLGNPETSTTSEEHACLIQGSANLQKEYGMTVEDIPQTYS